MHGGGLIMVALRGASLANLEDSDSSKWWFYFEARFIPLQLGGLCLRTRVSSFDILAPSQCFERSSSIV